MRIPIPFRYVVKVWPWQFDFTSQPEVQKFSWLHDFQNPLSLQRRWTNRNASFAHRPFKHIWLKRSGIFAAEARDFSVSGIICLYDTH